MSVQHHVGNIKVYIGVFAVLMLGTFLTVVAAVKDLGPLNVLAAPIAVFIATTKAVFVILFFMHVKDSDKLTKISVVAAFFWLCILFGLTMVDFLSRSWS